MTPTVFLPYVTKAPQDDFLLGDPPTPVGDSRKGLAMAQPPRTDLYRLKITGWWYNWKSVPEDVLGVPPGLPFYPMLWDCLPSPLLPASYAGPLLVMNEPNVEGQLNISPGVAVERLKRVRVAYPHARLIGPGISMWAFDWLEGFLRLGGGAMLSELAAHCYLEGEGANALGVDHAAGMLTQIHEMTGKPVRVTEFGDTRGRVGDFQALLDWFAAQLWICGFAPFTNRQPAWSLATPWVISKNVDLVNADGRLTPAGEVYARWGVKS